MGSGDRAFQFRSLRGQVASVTASWRTKLDARTQAGLPAIDKGIPLLLQIDPTLDIDDPILKEVKTIHRREGRSIGAIVSELLAEALAHRRPSRARRSFRWVSRPMKSLVDLADKEAVYAALDADPP